MKKYYTLVLAFGLVSGVSMAQFSMELVADSIQVRKLESDVEFDITLKNTGSSDLWLKWRITDHAFPSNEWEDYFCDYVCYTAATRAKDLDIPSDYGDFPMIHHIAIRDVEGIGRSTLCMWDRGDSAGTVQCILVKASTSAYYIYDTMTVGNLIIVEGVVYENTGGNWTAYAGGSQFSTKEVDLVCIDNVMYTFKNNGFVVYTPEEITLAGTTYFRIGDELYHPDACSSTLAGELEEHELGGKTAYIFNGDTFELLGDNYVPWSIAQISEDVAPLGQNTPNPFHATTVVNYNLDGGQNGELVVHDLTGKIVARHTLKPGKGQVTIGQGLREGVYFYTLHSSDGRPIATKRMAVVR